MNHTLLPLKPKKSLVSTRIPLEDGRTTDCFHLSEHPKEQDSTMSQNLSINKAIKHKSQPKKKISATVESLPKVKKMTSKDKSHTCKKDSRATKSSRTLHQASTSKEKVSDPLSSWLPKEESNKLWLPIETDCAALHSNWWNGSFKSIRSNSWFSIKKWTPLKRKKWQKIFSPSSTFLIAESMAGGNTNVKTRTNKARKSTKPVANMSRKIGLKPSPEVAKIFKEWFGSVRVTYNWALSCIKAKPSEYKKTNYIWLRKRFINKCNIPKDKAFLLKTPKSIRDTAVVELAEAYKSNYAKQSKNASHKFDLKYRSKKDDQSITITAEQIRKWDTKNKEFEIFPTFLKNKIKFNVNKNKTVPENINFDCKLLMSRLGKFSLVIVFHEPPCENQAGSKVCSLDPGVKTFQTVYSPTPGLCYKIGDADISRIFRLCKYLDTMIARGVCKKAIIRMRERIKNLVKEVHCKTVKFLVSKFKEIILPHFEVSHMVKKSNRKIRSKTVRQMLTWRHYGFKQRLISTAERCGVKVHILGEHYTSKTCTHCRNIKHNLGGSRIYKCKECHLVADRDCCGARNIFIKNTHTK